MPIKSNTQERKQIKNKKRIKKEGRKRDRKENVLKNRKHIRGRFITPTNSVLK